MNTKTKSKSNLEQCLRQFEQSLFLVILACHEHLIGRQPGVEDTQHFVACSRFGFAPFDQTILHKTQIGFPW